MANKFFHSLLFCFFPKINLLSETSIEYDWIINPILKRSFQSYSCSKLKAHLIKFSIAIEVL